MQVTKRLMPKSCNNRPDRKINSVLSKTLPVLGHAEFFEPVGNLLHRGTRRLSLPDLVGWRALRRNVAPPPSSSCLPGNQKCAQTLSCTQSVLGWPQTPKKHRKYESATTPLCD
jgi:hypothetical protein